MVERIRRGATMSGCNVALLVMAMGAQTPTKYGADGMFDGLGDATEDATTLIDGSLRY